MNNKELVAELAKRLEIPKGKAGRMLDIAANTLVQVVKQGSVVQLYGFGSC